ncbi:MAG: tetratricopeptide repeat protein [Kofleriaceae bacterium]
MTKLRALLVMTLACGGKPPTTSTPANRVAARPVAVDDTALDPLVEAVLPPPTREIGAAGAKVAMPAVPAFDLPPVNADGSHAVRELRVNGKRLLESTITITGFVTWIYDCPTALRQPGLTDKQIRARIDLDPTLCERAKFYIGDRPDTPAERSAWVVDIPRPYNKLEVERIKQSDRTAPDRCEPNTPAKQSVCPPLAVGDRIQVTGRWTLTSPHSERNSDGLLVYQSLKNVTRGWGSPGAVASQPVTVAPVAVARPPSPAMASTTKVVAAKVRRSALDAATELSNAGAVAYGSKQWETAIELFTQAVARWPGHHLAWYGLAASHAQRGDWKRAVDAGLQATRLAPDVAMYHLMAGRYLYEAGIQTARADQARRVNQPIEMIEVDLSLVSFEQAQAELAAARSLAPALWRTHYLLGSIARHAGEPKRAAELFTQAAMLGATESAPWIALAELYRAWDYADQAIEVALQGTAVVPGVAASSDLWFEVGMGYDDKRSDAKAIEAFTKSLDASRFNDLALFARGQAYFRRGDHANAKRDLEAFVRSGRTQLDFFMQQASRMLMDIAAKRRP